MSTANTKRAHDGKCGGCKWFDGTCLDDHGHGDGECCAMPPTYIGPTGDTVRSMVDLYDTLDDFWVSPTVGVAREACRLYKRRKKRAWWDE